jgi:hypothetical protein
VTGAIHQNGSSYGPGGVGYRDWNESL